MLGQKNLNPHSFAASLKSDPDTQLRFCRVHLHILHPAGWTEIIILHDIYKLSWPLSWPRSPTSSCEVSISLTEGSFFFSNDCSNVSICLLQCLWHAISYVLSRRRHYISVNYLCMSISRHSASNNETTSISYMHVSNNDLLMIHHIIHSLCHRA